MSDTENQLLDLRQQIDGIDKEIHSLLSRRAQCASDVAEVKKASGAAEIVYYRPEREAQVLRRVKDRNDGPLNDDDVARVFRAIMSACLALEEPMKVAFLGPAGTFSHGASLKQFGPSMVAMPMQSIDQVFREVSAHSAHYGVVPIENSTEGVVNQTLDMLIDSPLHVCGEVAIPVHQHLLRAPNDDTPLQRIYSHQQAFAQCCEWLNTNLPNVERVSVSSTAYAAQLAAKEPGAAAISGEMAVEEYGVRIEQQNIEDNPENITRFLVIGRKEIPPSGIDKTSLLMVIPHEPGALLDALATFKKHQINMTFIEVRPSRNKMWDYIFFIDVDGHCEEAAMQEALADIKEQAILLKNLGSYPKAVIEA